MKTFVKAVAKKSFRNDFGTNTELIKREFLILLSKEEWRHVTISGFLNYLKDSFNFNCSKAYVYTQIRIMESMKLIKIRKIINKGLVLQEYLLL
jgi:hypothetical protein